MTMLRHLSRRQSLLPVSAGKVLVVAGLAALSACGGGDDGSVLGTAAIPTSAAQYPPVIARGSDVNTGSPGTHVVRAKARACKVLAAGLRGSEHARFTSECLRKVFKTIVFFGDSISDVGSHKVGTIAAVGGGKWIVNTPAALVWGEYLARELGSPAPCAAQTGLLPNIPGLVGAAVVDHPECTNYAQATSRVSSSYAPNSVALQGPPFNQVNVGFMSMPITAQMDAHLAKVGAYDGYELVNVSAQGYDLSMQFNAILAAGSGGAAAVAFASVAGWPEDVQAVVAGGGPAATNAAVAAAVTSMGQLGDELASAVKTKVLAKGARFVNVHDQMDPNQTPMAAAFDAQTRALVDQLVATYNAHLRAGLEGTPAHVLDMSAYVRSLYENAAAYGFSNTTTPACSTTSAANPLQGLALACTAASTVEADTSGYFYADSLHSTQRVHELTAMWGLEELATAPWY